MAQLYTWPGEGGTSTPADLQAVQPGQGKDVVRTSQTGPREPEGQRVVIRMVSSRSDSGSDVSGGDDREGVDVDDGGGVAYSGVTPSSVGGDGSRLVERRRDIGGSGGILSLSSHASSGAADVSGHDSRDVLGARPKERLSRQPVYDDVAGGFVHLSVDDEVSFRTPVDQLDRRRREEPDLMHFTGDVGGSDDDDHDDISRDEREGLRDYGGTSTGTDYSSAYDGSFSDSAFVRSDDEYYDSRGRSSRDGSRRRSRSRSDDGQMGRTDGFRAKISASTQTGTDQPGASHGVGVQRERQRSDVPRRHRRVLREREEDSSRSPSASSKVRSERVEESRDRAKS